MNPGTSRKIVYEAIGIIHSPFQTTEDMPIQPSGSTSISGYAEIYPEYQEGLQDLDGFSHVILLYCFHKVSGCKLTVKPFLDDATHGVFATRAPVRPNPVGLTVTKLAAIEGTRIHLENIDILDGTPLLDIKPYVPEFDRPGSVRTGWLESAKRKASEVRSDNRFT
jgi:tRNA-Thr(GGU) m(6)t(6)A37 methyltransferase TsaA